MMAAPTSQNQDPPSVPLHTLSLHAQWAALSIRDALAKFQNEAGIVPTKGANKYSLLPIGNTHPQDGLKVGDGTGFKVGIIGAGVAGMFTALIFDYLNETYNNLNVTYEILEADKNRCGGRLYTYTFPPRDKQPAISKHDYYDVGAMRFPHVKGGVMERTFQLFVDTLKMNYIDPTKTTPQLGDLIPYYFKGPNNPYLYNSIQVVPKPNNQGSDIPVLSAATFQVPNIPANHNIQTTAASDLVNNQFTKYKTIYDQFGPKAFWDALIKEVDPYSVRQFLTDKAGFDYDTIEFLETLDSGNRWYDQAASEMVLEYLDFDPVARWWCVEGGTTEIATKMQATIKEQNAIQFGKSVTAISYNNSNPQNLQVDVTVDGEASVRTYDAVFNSAPLGAMQHMQLEGLNLEWGMKSSIRSLGYGASCKVGIRFDTMWWMDPNGLAITQGGQAKTDLPIRCCVYPSYNIYDPQTGPGVLLVSYTWSAEAERIGALINRGSPDHEEPLKNLLFHDLARLHAKSGDDDDYQRLHKLISDSYLDHFAYNWYQNPRTVGAFAWFGPQQFSNYYNNLTASAGKYMVIGEAASAHHAWVVGALESAVRGVYQFLCNSTDSAAQDVAKDYELGKIPGPFGPLPSEYSRTDDIKLPEGTELSGAMPSPVGELARMQVLLEGIRLKQGGDRLDPSKITEDQIKPILDLLDGKGGEKH